MCAQSATPTGKHGGRNRCPAAPSFLCTILLLIKYVIGNKKRRMETYHNAEKSLVPQPARSHTYASQTPSLGSAQGLLLTRVGSPLARQDSHLLDDRQSFMVALQPPIPFDQPCLVALFCLFYSQSELRNNS